MPQDWKLGARLSPEAQAQLDAAPTKAEHDALLQVLSGANEVQVGGDHYESQEIQPWDYIVANNLGFLEGNVVKYVTRHTKKNGLEDLNKARHYLDKLIEVESAKYGT